MNRVLRIIVLGVVLAAVAFGQVEPQTRAERRAAAPAASMSPGDSSSPAPRHLYEHHTNFYEFVLHQLNPNDKDWGAWYEERRAALIDAALHDPCFWYCLGLTLACLCSGAAVLKSQSDQDRQDDIMEERLDEVRRFAALSHQVALEAIDKYNTHIELCNRAIEAEEAGHTTAVAGGSQNSQPQANPTKAREETELQKRDKTRMESEASHTATTTPDRSDGGSSPSNKGGTNGQGKEPPNPLTPSYADLVHQINILQQQLIAEQDKNKRLKGGA
ncbi:MAG: hypothetical protein WA005_15410 [Candidatus Binataceae bacterium]